MREIRSAETGDRPPVDLCLSAMVQCSRRTGIWEVLKKRLKQAEEGLRQVNEILSMLADAAAAESTDSSGEGSE
jgi:hypothetical protein